MSNEKQKRVLAYTLAKEITHKELTEISGGSHMSYSTTLRPSGQFGAMDAVVDVSVDW